MTISCTALYIVLGLAGLFLLLIILYFLLQLLGAVRRSYEALLGRPSRKDPISRILETRREAEEDMDLASREFLEDVYRQSAKDWSRF